MGWKESRNNLSAGSLAELRAVVERELATHPAARVPRVEKLNEVLLDLGGQHTQAGGAWARFKKWLRDLLSRRDKGEDTNWFDRMVSRVGVSAVVGEIITYAALGIVVALALIIVFNELKAAGLLGRRMAGAEGESAGGTVAARRLPALGDIEKVPLLERPAMLLDVIAWKLASIGRLPPPGALTVREMERSADLQGEEDRRRLSRLALTAERARFAHEGVPQTALQQACDEGRELLQSVETLRAPAPATSAALEAST